MPTIRANGLDIAYEVHGAGPPLVLLHGASSLGREDFAAQIPLFSKRFLCYVPDARGHGATRWDAADGFRYDWLVDDLAAFVDELGLDTFHVVGFSMGAMTALMFGSRHPERLRTLTIVGITTQREPRMSVLRGLTNLERIDREDQAWAALLGRRHDAGQGVGAWRRLLPAIAADVAAQPLLDAARAPPDRCPEPRRLRRPRPVRPRRARLGDPSPARRRAAVRRARLRARGDVPQAGPVQRGAGGVLPDDGERRDGARRAFCRGTAAPRGLPVPGTPAPGHADDDPDRGRWTEFPHDPQ